MSLHDVTRLRHEGRYDEAYDMALHDIETHDDEQSRASLFWTLRDVCRHGFLPARRMDAFTNCLDLMGKLLRRIDDPEKTARYAYRDLHKHISDDAGVMSRATAMSAERPSEAYLLVREACGGTLASISRDWHDDLGWIVYRYLKASSGRIASVEVRRLLRDYINLDNRRPSLLHSLVLNFAVNYAAGHRDFSFYRFFRMWNPSLLRDDDMHDRVRDGRTGQSLLKRAFRVLATGGETIDVADIISFLPVDKETALDLLRQPIHDKMLSFASRRQYDRLWHAFTVYAQCYSPFGPSPWHSRILALALEHMANGDAWRFALFFEHWGKDNLRSDDWLSGSREPQVTRASLGVAAASRYLDACTARPAARHDATVAAWAKRVVETIAEHERLGIVNKP